jgi:hypothetical protein
MVIPKLVNVIPHRHIQTHQEQEFQGNIFQFLKVSINVFSPSLFSDEQGMCHCEEPVHYGDLSQMVINLWLSNEHYEPIIKI